MPPRQVFRTWDDYFIPGTSVLKNRFGETDPVRLRQLEEFSSAVRVQELFERPIQRSFDYAHMKAIHRYVFQDVYEWAGEERTAPNGFMTKDGHAYYGAGAALTEAADAEYAKLAQKNLLRGLDLESFVYELAESWGELNVVHSFREGNTRAQFVFYSQLAEQAGYRIDVNEFAVGSALRDEFVAARFHSQDTGDNSRLADVLRRAVAPLAPSKSARKAPGSGGIKVTKVAGVGYIRSNMTGRYVRIDAPDRGRSRRGRRGGGDTN